MMKINNNLQYHVDKFVYNNQRKTTSKKIFISCLSFVVAMIISLMFIYAVPSGANPIEIVKTLFTEGFADMTARTGTLVWMGILGLSALSFIIPQKAGMFNVGVIGQIFGGSVLAYLIGVNITAIPAGIGQILMLAIAMAFGAAYAWFAAFLKNRYNVHEVVSTILINWIIFFIGTVLLKEFTRDSIASTTSYTLIDNLRLYDPITNSAWIPSIVLFVIALVGVWVILKFTKYGVKISATGMSEEGSRNAGYKTHKLRSNSMMISGAMAGALGILIYTGLNPNMEISYTRTLPPYGFNGISVGLLAMWNPWGIAFFSFIFGILDAGRDALSSIGVNPTFVALILGIVIYLSAILSSLTVYKPWIYVYKHIKGERYYDGRKAYVDFLLTQMDYLDYKNSTSKKENLTKIELVKYKQQLYDDYFKFKADQKNIIFTALKKPGRGNK